MTETIPGVVSKPSLYPSDCFQPTLTLSKYLLEESWEKYSPPLKILEIFNSGISVFLEEWFYANVVWTKYDLLVSLDEKNMIYLDPLKKQYALWFKVNNRDLTLGFFWTKQDFMYSTQTISKISKNYLHFILFPANSFAENLSQNVNPCQLF